MNSGKRVAILLRVTISALLLPSALLPELFAQNSPAPKPSAEVKTPLREGWSLQSSSKVEAKGEVISTAAFAPTGWSRVTVPTTVVAALVKEKKLPDPFFGTNLRQFPGVTYPVGGNFSNIAMQSDSPYAVSWWYRKQFVAPAAYKGKTVWLKFNGINYRANIWLNGKQIATSNDVAGAWRTYEFNITDAVKPGAENALAVQVWAPTESDLAITFVDWNPAPPDKNMGLWREVYLTTSGPVAVRYPTVVSKLDLPANDHAQLTVTAQLKNGTGQPVKGKLKGQIESIEFEQEVELAANEAKDVTFTPEQFSQLIFNSPRLWWPAQMGKPNLYPLTMEFDVDGKVSDRSESHFGIREITSDVNSVGGRAFHVNGKNILIRGAVWSPDMMLRENSQRLRDELRCVVCAFLRAAPFREIERCAALVNVVLDSPTKRSDIRVPRPLRLVAVTIEAGAHRKSTRLAARPGWLSGDWRIGVLASIGHELQERDSSAS